MRTLAVSVMCLLAVGCVSTQYALVEPGDVVIEDLAISAGGGWNKAPGILIPYMEKGGEMWSRDGALLDRLYIFPGVANGGKMFKSSDKSIVYPEFSRDMLPNEIVELAEASFTTLYGSNTIVESSGLRPTRLGEQRAIMFDLSVTTSEEPKRRGRVLAFVAAEKLYLLAYVATDLHYFDKHWESALSIMESAKITSS